MGGVAGWQADKLADCWFAGWFWTGLVWYGLVFVVVLIGTSCYKAEYNTFKEPKLTLSIIDIIRIDYGNDQNKH